MISRQAFDFRAPKEIGIEFSNRFQMNKHIARRILVIYHFHSRHSDLVIRVLDEADMSFR